MHAFEYLLLQKLLFQMFFDNVINCTWRWIVIYSDIYDTIAQ